MSADAGQHLASTRAVRDLIADRFAAPTEGRVVDLATGLDIDLERLDIGPGIDALGAPGVRDRGGRQCSRGRSAAGPAGRE